MCASASSASLRCVVTAASSITVTPATPTKVCASSRLSSGVLAMNGPMSLLVKPTAMAATTRLAAVAPGCQNRSAAQISSGKTRYARLVSCENTSALTPIVVAASATASSLRPGTRV